MSDTNGNQPISQEEFKKASEELYKQNLELARLYKEVETLNRRREALVHLVNHKVKGAFTHSKYVFAGMLDGTFGDISAEIKERAQQGLEATEIGIRTIDIFLNADNLQKGGVKYNMVPLDFKELLLKALEEKKGAIQAKGLKLETNITDDTYNVTGDSLWLKEIIHNFVQNAILYTKEGTITVGLQKKDGKILFSVKDTGVGLAEEDKVNLFTEGGRGKESTKMNVDSTGYGLYSVKLIGDAHKARVWAESEGVGKGSQFYMELDAVA